MSLKEANRLYSQGRQKLADGDLQGAIAKFKQALQFNPNYPTALLAAARAMNKKGDYTEACRYFERAIQLRPNDSYAYCDLGYALFKLGQYQNAILNYQKSVDIKPDYPNPYCGIGESLWKLAKYEESISSYQQALKIDPNYYHAHNGIGNTFKDLGEYEKALNFYHEAIKLNPNYHHSYNGIGNALRELSRYEEAIENYQKVIRLNPNYYHAHNGLGNTFYDLKQYEKAIESYEQSTKINPNYSPAYNGLGNALWKLAKYEEAIHSYQQALKIDPNYYLAHNGIGNAFYDLKQYEKAIESYEQSTKINPNYSSAYNGLGNALWKLAKYEEAIHSYQQAIKIDPNYYLAYSGRGDALWKVGRYEEAIDSYNQSIKLNPNYYWPHNGLGNVFQDLGNYEKAIESYEEAIRINPTYYHAYNGLGSVFEKLERYEKALGAYQEAVKINPNISSLYNHIGIILHSLEKRHEALVNYEKAIEIQSSNCNAYNNLGNIWYKLGDYEKAIINYEKAIDLHPECPNPWKGKGDSIWNSKGIDSVIDYCEKSISELKIKGAEFKGVIGKLYELKGDSYYQRGKTQYQYFSSSLTKSVNSYLAAIEIFEQIAAKEFYLAALQKVVKVLLGLNRVEETDELLRKGTDYLHRWLGETPNSFRRKALALKFAGFNQLTVDHHIQSAIQLEDEEVIKATLRAALEIAEKGKNACLSWLLYALNDEVANLDYEVMQQFLTPGTAIVYWHLSPAALTTFILKSGESAPILITQTSESDRPASLQQLLKLEAWMKEWDEQYRDYRNKGKEQRDAAHSWRKDMAQRLFGRRDEPGNLKEILNITAIEQQLDGINYLVLIPHRDLHRFPLHALFDPRFIASYLPSLKVGFSTKGRQPSHTGYLLSIENPASDRNNPLEFARVESQAISQTFQKVNLIQDAEATQETVMNALNEGCNVLHFSGHASHHSENPQMSELLLAGAGGLTLQEICQHDLTRYDLVSLSACETALTNNQSITTEYVGLVSGFLYSGVAQVVSTLWVVESAVSALVMIEFYRRRSYKSDNIALAEAIQWLRSLTYESFKAWQTERLAELPSTLPRERRLRIKRTLDHALARWGKIEQDIQNPYSWAAFTLSGGFF